MRFFDFLLFAGVCFIWAVNIVVSRVLFTDFGVPPIFYAAVRFALVALVLAPLLHPLPKPFLPLLLVGMLMGACHFGFMFLALQSSPSSSVSVVLQLSIPETALLSVVLLNERIGLIRAGGIAIALCGVLMVMWNQGDQAIGLGLIFAFVSSLALSLGSISLKRYGPIHPMRIQAWVALASFPPLAAYSWLAEDNPAQASFSAGWPFWAGWVFSAFLVTIVAHTLYFSVLQRYPASLIAPLGLMMPLMSVAMGVFLLGEHFNLLMVTGSVIAFGGLYLILRRQASNGPDQTDQIIVSDPGS